MSKSQALYYETSGDAANPCIILIMGIGGQLIHWPASFVKALVEQGYFVVRFDNRDAGLSKYYDDHQAPDLMALIEAKQKGQPITIPYSLNDMANDVIALMDELKIAKAVIAGISMGGMIAQLVAIHHPKRVEGLVCIATTNGDPALPPAKQAVLDFFFSPQREFETKESYVENKMTLHRIYNHPDHLDEVNVRQVYRETYDRSHRPDGFKRQLLALIMAEPRLQQLEYLNTPTLVIHGDYDPVFPLAHGEALARLIPGAEIEVIKNLGHGLPDCLSITLVERIAKFIRERVKYANRK